MVWLTQDFSLYFMFEIFILVVLPFSKWFYFCMLFITTVCSKIALQTGIGRMICIQRMVSLTSMMATSTRDELRKKTYANCFIQRLHFPKIIWYSQDATSLKSKLMPFVTVILKKTLFTRYDQIRPAWFYFWCVSVIYAFWIEQSNCTRCKENLFADQPIV